MDLNDVLQINDALEMDEKQERELNEVIVSLHPHKVLISAPIDTTLKTMETIASNIVGRPLEVSPEPGTIYIDPDRTNGPEGPGIYIRVLRDREK